MALLAVWCQAIIWANADILLISTLGNKLQWNFNQYTTAFIQENASENVICRIKAILPCPQSVNMWAYFFQTAQHLKG